MGESSCPAGYAARAEPLIISFQKGKYTVFTKGKILSGDGLFTVKLLIMRKGPEHITEGQAHYAYYLTGCNISDLKSQGSAQEHESSSPGRTEAETGMSGYRFLVFLFTEPDHFPPKL